MMLLKLLFYTSLITSLATTVYSISELENLFYSLPATGFQSYLAASKNTIKDQAENEKIYDYKNSNDLTKVIQNILLLHLKQNSQPKAATAPATIINSKTSCNSGSCEDKITTESITESPKTSTELITTTAMINVTQPEIETIRNLVKNEILLKLKAKTLNLADRYGDSTEKIYIYFIISIIFLALLVLLLIVVLSVCCVIYYKQKARLDYYLNENYFTYFNNKKSRGKPTYTVTEAMSESGDNKLLVLPKTKTVDNKLMILEEKAGKLGSLKSNLQPLKEEEEGNEIEGQKSNAKKNSFRIMNKCKPNFICLNGLNSNESNDSSTSNLKTVINVVSGTKKPSENEEDDDEDIVLEGDLNVINSLNIFAAQQHNHVNMEGKEHEPIKITKFILDERQKNELKKQLKLNDSTTTMETVESCNSDVCTTSSAMTNPNSNLQIIASPAVMRDRYYKLLREQVFPYLHRAVTPSNAKAKSIKQQKQNDNFVNDVLY